MDDKTMVAKLVTGFGIYLVPPFDPEDKPVLRISKSYLEITPEEQEYMEKLLRDEQGRRTE
jgi:hypothetical protein